MRAKALPLSGVAATPPGQVCSGLVEAMLAQLIDGVTNALAADATRVARLSALFGALDGHASLPLLMTKADYADRLSYSIRKLDQLIASGLPTLGRGRALRIPLREADAWVHSNLSSVTDEEADVDLEAMAAARRRTERRRQ